MSLHNATNEVGVVLRSSNRKSLAVYGSVRPPGPADAGLLVLEADCRLADLGRWLDPKGAGLVALGCHVRAVLGRVLVAEGGRGVVSRDSLVAARDSLAGDPSQGKQAELGRS